MVLKKNIIKKSRQTEIINISGAIALQITEYKNKEIIFFGGCAWLDLKVVVQTIANF